MICDNNISVCWYLSDISWNEAIFHGILDKTPLVTGVEVITENCFPEVVKYCPKPKVKGNISPTKGKWYPIMTNDVISYWFCYTS